MKRKLWRNILCLCLSLVMSISPVYAGEVQNLAVGQDQEKMVTVDFFPARADYEIIAVNGKSVSDTKPESYSGESYPVGTTFTLSTPERFNDNIEDYQFNRWWVNEQGDWMFSVEYKEGTHDEYHGTSFLYYKENFDDIYETTTTFTILELCASEISISPNYLRDNEYKVRNMVKILDDNDLMEQLELDLEASFNGRNEAFGYYFEDYTGNREEEAR